MENRLTKVKEYTQAAIDTLLVTRNKFDILEPLMKNDALAKRFSGGLRPQARNTLIGTVYLDCSLSLLAISGDCNRDGTTPSVCNILRLLKSDDLRNRLRDEFSKPIAYDLESLPEESRKQISQDLAAKDEVERQCQFDKTYEKVRQQFDAFMKEEVCLRLKKVRDKVHAHKEMTSQDGKPRLRTLEEFGIKVGDLEIFMNSIENLLLELEPLMGSHHYLNDFKIESKSMAKQFWGVDEGNCQER